MITTTSVWNPTTEAAAEAIGVGFGGQNQGEEKPTPTRSILSLYIDFPVPHQFKTFNVTQCMVAYLRY